MLWRDAGEWENVATLGHPDGWMVATWFQASAEDFIARSRRARDDGLKVLHASGASSIAIAGDRAVAQTKMEIVQRAPLHGGLADVVCRSRFWDAFERSDGRWLLLFRQPIYELDHLVPVDPATRPEIDRAELEAFPEGYRHLAYLQTHLGFTVTRAMPGTHGPEVEGVYARGRRWPAGEAAACLHADR